MKRLCILSLLLGLSLVVTAPVAALPPSCYAVCLDGWTKPCSCGPVVTSCAMCGFHLSAAEERLCTASGPAIEPAEPLAPVALPAE